MVEGSLETLSHQNSGRVRHMKRILLAKLFMIAGLGLLGACGEQAALADLDEGPNASIMPLMGTIYRVAPLTAPHELLASDPALFLPRDWLDPAHVVAG